jgi:hypothetical protein
MTTRAGHFARREKEFEPHGFCAHLLFTLVVALD